MNDAEREREVARRALAALDLTSLGEDDDAARIIKLCDAAVGPGGLPAAVCIYPQHVTTARRRLAELGADSVLVATVVNFPDGSTDEDRSAREAREAVAAGADEVDMVLPWRALIAGEKEAARRVVRACRRETTGHVLKVILESGGLQTSALIAAASRLALDEGADFIKTSTGKIEVGATPAAARTMLEIIHERGGGAGFKAAGGVRTLADAAIYLGLADEILGPGWTTQAHFRIGASGLLTAIRAALAGDEAPGPQGSGY